MGRFKDGTPLTLYDTDNGGKGADLEEGFDYREFIAPERGAKNNGYLNDENGTRCPLHAHIRKANPRRKEENEYDPYNMARRGVLYCSDADRPIEKQKRFDKFKKTTDKKREDILKGDSEVGMLFMSFQRNLEFQFEKIVNGHLHSNFNENGMNSGKDILTSEADNWPRKIPAQWNSREQKAIERKKPLIHFRGGAYFFAPSISFLSNFDKRCFPPIKAEDLGRSQKKDVAEMPNPVPDYFNLETGGMRVVRKDSWESVLKP